MASIFYWKDTGKIYGVHPDRNIKVPDGIESLDVPGLPHQIAWPVPPGQVKGSEAWSVIDMTTDPPTLKAKPDIEVNPDLELEQAIEDAKTLNELKDALLGKTRKGKIKAR